MKILLVGEYYSTNLGDPLLCQTVYQTIMAAYPKAQLVPFDISGKTGYGTYYEAKAYPYAQRWYLRLKNRLPALWKRVTLYRGMAQDEPRHLRVPAMLEDVLEKDTFDLAVFAGGALFMDYFAAIINRIVKRLAAAKTPVMFHACGMGKLNSDSVKLLQQAFRCKNVKWISLRDSYRRFLESFSSNAKVEETFDTALLCSEYYEPSAQKQIRYGIGIMDVPEYYDFQKNLISWFMRSEYSWKLFINGSWSDKKTARHLMEELSLPENCLICSQTPEELVKAVTGFESILSFRMHSQIVAASFGIPCFGFLWDEKIGELYRKLEFPENCGMPVANLDMEEMLQKLEISPAVLRENAHDAGDKSRSSLIAGIEWTLKK